jgi:hypothetical protein
MIDKIYQFSDVELKQWVLDNILAAKNGSMNLHAYYHYEKLMKEYMREHPLETDMMKIWLGACNVILKQTLQDNQDVLKRLKEC